MTALAIWRTRRLILRSAAVGFMLRYYGAACTTLRSPVPVSLSAAPSRSRPVIATWKRVGMRLQFTRSKWTMAS